MDGPLLPCPHSLAYSRRSRYSKVLRRYSIEAPPDPVLEELRKDPLLMDDPVISAAAGPSLLGLSYPRRGRHLSPQDQRRVASWKSRLKARFTRTEPRVVFFVEETSSIGTSVSSTVGGGRGGRGVGGSRQGSCNGHNMSVSAVVDSRVHVSRSTACGTNTTTTSVTTAKTEMARSGKLPIQWTRNHTQ